MTEPATSKLKDTADKMRALFEEAYELFVDRNNHHRDVFMDDGRQGIIVRAKDKINDVKRGGKPPRETVKECWLDVANYALMGALLEDEGLSGE